VCLMLVPLAVSGKVVLGVAIVGGLLFVAFLLRGEDREQARNEDESQP